MATGGDFKEFTFNHPIEGSGTIFLVSGEDTTMDLGGIRSTDDMNMVDTAGNMIDVLKNSRWSVEGTVSWDMNTELTLEKINALSASPILADWTMSHINGSVYGAKGKPVGDLKGNSSKATFPLKLSGGGKLKKII